MRFSNLKTLAFVWAAALAVPALVEAQAVGQGPTAQAQPATTQPGVVAPIRGGHQGFKSTPVQGAKPGANAPPSTITLKPGEVPGIKFDTQIYDFGRIRAGSDVEHDYWFTNTGTGPLEILAVRPG
jgi:hypothetical protein